MSIEAASCPAEDSANILHSEKFDASACSLGMPFVSHCRGSRGIFAITGSSTNEIGRDPVGGDLAVGDAASGDVAGQHEFGRSESKVDSRYTGGGLSE